MRMFKAPKKVVEFCNSANAEEQERQARRSYEMMQAFLRPAG